MGRVGSITTERLAGLLRSDAGIAAAVAALAVSEHTDLPAINGSEIVEANWSTELADKTQGGRYPQICVYCERVVNSLTEKFRRFSGKAFMSIEVRVSQDRADAIGQRLQLYVEAVTRVLEESRGEWSGGIFYSGAYDIRFGNIRQGGKNFVQNATVAIELDVSQD